MRIELTKKSGTHHRLCCIRKEGTIEEALLETKSFLVHDLTHLAYENTFGLQASFWGSVASGSSFAELREPMNPATARPDTSELVQTEMIVGPLQGVMQGRRSAEDVLAGLANLFSAYDVSLPEVLTVEGVGEVQERFRKKFGEWNALGIGEMMVVEWEEGSKWG